MEYPLWELFSWHWLVFSHIFKPCTYLSHWRRHKVSSNRICVALEAAWPLYGLVVQTPRLELRLATDNELAELALEAFERGVHDPGFMPFQNPWTAEKNPQKFLMGFMQHYWKVRKEWAPEKWDLGLGVYFEGKLIGSQGMEAHHFSVTRVATSGSWLLQEYHGKGIGKEMRMGILALAFDHLGASEMYSGAMRDNKPSAGVSKSLGYRMNGTKIVDREGKPTRNDRFTISRRTWKAKGITDIKVTGVEACYSLFGI